MGGTLRQILGPVGVVAAKQGGLRSTRSHAVISPIGQSPIIGKTSASSRRLTHSACRTVCAPRHCSYQRSVTARKVFDACSRSLRLRACFATTGSVPDFSVLRASSRATRAAARSTAG